MKTKKIITIITIVLVLFSGLAGCNNNDNKFTLDKAIKLYQSEGFGVDKSAKPTPNYLLIGAKDGVVFDLNGVPVRIYEFNTEADYERGCKILKEMKKYPKHDLVVIDTKSSDAKRIWNYYKTKKK